VPPEYKSEVLSLETTFSVTGQKETGDTERFDIMGKISEFEPCKSQQSRKNGNKFQ
jgi:hypothetical protein